MKRRTATCAGCGAEIIWCVTQNGKRQPVDAEPNPKGNLELRDVLNRFDPVSVVIDLWSDPNCERFMPHHATCPNADEFRKQGGRT